jgi:hypothetical protein
MTSFEEQFASQQQELAALTSRIASFSDSPISGRKQATPFFDGLLTPGLGDHFELGRVDSSHLGMKHEIANSELKQREDQLIGSMQQIAEREQEAEKAMQLLESQISTQTQEQRAKAAILKQREDTIEQQFKDLSREKERTAVHMKSASRALKNICKSGALGENQTTGAFQCALSIEVTAFVCVLSVLRARVRARVCTLNVCFECVLCLRALRVWFVRVCFACVLCVCALRVCFACVLCVYTLCVRVCVCVCDFRMRLRVLSVCLV